jgi:hypothetical protein
VIATFFEVFPNSAIFANTVRGQGYDVVLIGQADPIRIDIDKMQAKLESPAYAATSKSLQEIGFNSAIALLGTYAGTPDGSAELVERSGDHSRQGHANTVSGRPKPEPLSRERHLPEHGEVRPLHAKRNVRRKRRQSPTIGSDNHSGLEPLIFHLERFVAAMFGCQSMVGPLRRVIVKRPEEAFQNAQAISDQWRGLNYLRPPNFQKACEEHARLTDLLRSLGAEVLELPIDAGTGLDSIYTHDPVLITERGAILFQMGKTARRGEAPAFATAFKRWEFRSLEPSTAQRPRRPAT